MRREEIRQATDAVKEDHELLIGQLHALEETLALTREDEQEESHVLAVLEQLRHYFLNNLLLHLQKEEQQFFPAVGQLPLGQGKLTRLRKEHGQLRQGIDDFKASLTLTGYVGPQSRQALLWRLITDGRTILARLQTHAAFECELVRELHGLEGNSQKPAAVVNGVAVPVV
jgi:iron-sulfur cluster repair protein YtfE (RIC family)